MKPKVSIIVPIYNMESYLERCLESLINQSLKELEVVAINDGSTDRSLEILQSYALKDSRIKIIDQINSGVSASRNVGIHFSTGQFIGFVDPDDWADQEMFETLYKTALIEEADMVMCSYIREFGGHSKEKQFDVPDYSIYQHQDVHSEFLRRLVGPLGEEVGNPELLDAWGTVWTKLYRSELIKDHDVTFVDLKEIGTNEDSLFNLNVLYFARKLIFINKPYYHYWRVSNSSITSHYKSNLINQFFNLYSKMEAFIKEKELSSDFLKALNNRICLNTLGLGFNSISDGSNASHLERVRRIRELLNDNRIKASFKEFDLSAFPIIWRVFYFCAKSKLTLSFYLLLTMAEVMRRKAS